MSCLPISSRTIEDLPYDRLKDICENHETLSSSAPEVQDMVCELLEKDEEKSSVCPGLLLKPMAEIVYAIAFKILENARPVDLKCILSMVGRTASVTLDTDERMAITKEIPPNSLLAAMENYVSEKKKLQTWGDGEENRLEAIQKVFNFLDDSCSDSSALNLANLGLTTLPPFFLGKFGEVKTCFLTEIN